MLEEPSKRLPLRQCQGKKEMDLLARVQPLSVGVGKRCRDEQCFLDLLVALIHSVKEFSITFTNFPHSLISMFSVTISINI